MSLCRNTDLPAASGSFTAESGQGGPSVRIAEAHFCDLHRTSAYMYRVHSPLTIILDAL